MEFSWNSNKQQKQRV